MWSKLLMYKYRLGGETHFIVYRMKFDKTKWSFPWNSSKNCTQNSADVTASHMTSFDRPDCQATLAASFAQWLSIEWNSKRLDGPARAWIGWGGGGIWGGRGFVATVRSRGWGGGGLGMLGSGGSGGGGCRLFRCHWIHLLPKLWLLHFFIGSLFLLKFQLRHVFSQNGHF